MGQTALDQALKLIEELEPEELRQVQEAAQKRLAADEQAAMERVFEALLASGMVKEIKRPSGRTEDRHPPVPIKGKPISETIIEERR